MHMIMEEPHLMSKHICISKYQHLSLEAQWIKFITQSLILYTTSKEWLHVYLHLIRQKNDKQRQITITWVVLAAKK